MGDNYYHGLSNYYLSFSYFPNGCFGITVGFLSHLLCINGSCVPLTMKTSVVILPHPLQCAEVVHSTFVSFKRDIVYWLVCYVVFYLYRRLKEEDIYLKSNY